jgi:hypothetical protein
LPPPLTSEIAVEKPISGLPVRERTTGETRERTTGKTGGEDDRENQGEDDRASGPG